VEIQPTLPRFILRNVALRSSKPLGEIHLSDTRVLPGAAQDRADPRELPLVPLPTSETPRIHAATVGTIGRQSKMDYAADRLRCYEVVSA
jgi:hypothetical protein